jgi:hypothetical protein
MNEPIVQQIGPRTWRLHEDWHYTTPQDLHIVIPKGFEFDGASIPRALWPIATPSGSLFLASIIHDWGYQHGYVILEDGERVPKGRWYFDDLFHEMAKARGAAIGHAAWAAVRLFGFSSWRCKV